VEAVMTFEEIEKLELTMKRLLLTAALAVMLTVPAAAYERQHLDATTAAIVYGYLTGCGKISPAAYSALTESMMFIEPREMRVEGTVIANTIKQVGLTDWCAWAKPVVESIR
jgi:hypothetical protein